MKPLPSETSSQSDVWFFQYPCVKVQPGPGGGVVDFVFVKVRTAPTAPTPPIVAVAETPLPVVVTPLLFVIDHVEVKPVNVGSVTVTSIEPPDEPFTATARHLPPVPVSAGTL